MFLKQVYFVITITSGLSALFRGKNVNQGSKITLTHSYLWVELLRAGYLKKKLARPAGQVEIHPGRKKSFYKFIFFEFYHVLFKYFHKQKHFDSLPGKNALPVLRRMVHNVGKWSKW